jgi:hypothetical protein
MKRRVVLLSVVLLLGIVVLGCEPPRPAANAPPAAPQSAAPTATTSAPPPPATSPAPLPPETKFGVFAGDVNDLAAQPAAPQPAPQAGPPADSNSERVKAQAGVGAKGRSLDQHEGLVVTPVKAFFAGKERAFFDLEFPGNYRTWRAQEDHAPKDFEELKAKFLDPMGLTKKLPQLPPDAKYVWDGEKEELQVERPRKQ